MKSITENCENKNEEFWILYFRISDELNIAPVETFYKSMDFGEKVFIEKFLALETSIS